MKKKVVALVLATLLALSLMACNEIVADDKKGEGGVKPPIAYSDDKGGVKPPIARMV